MKDSGLQASDIGHKVGVLVALPAYNEATYVGSVVLQARQYADEVIVLDDGSTDNTSRVATLAGATVIQHAKNEGYGATIKDILAQAKERNADILVILDADSQHNPDEIPALIKPISEGFDLVIGSREMQSNVIPLYRRIGQRILSNLTFIASRQKLSDTESGFRAYSRKAIAGLELKEKGMAASSEIVSTATSKGLKVTEVPITVTYTKDGSTLNPVRHGIGVLGRIMAMISERRPLLFFGLIGVILTVIGLVTGIKVLNLATTTGTLAMGSIVLTSLLLTIGILSIFTGMILNALIKRK